MSIYEFEVNKINGETISLEEYKGKVMIIVNTASKCGFSPQYDDLQSLYVQYKEDGVVVLGFPCNQFLNQEPGDDLEIDSYCKLNHGVTFPMFAKVNVKGKEAHPLFSYLTENAPGVMGSKSIKWNFTKFLIDRNGNIVSRFAPKTKPLEMEEDIKKLI
ncbi:glutathione peroxidase [Peribacillus frigoritolerans]|jgi:glutathione peroxidase|uniref:Glutathione peroxidase n=2 Tax=Peribacillus TaxID=2675229 RepID=A0AAJ1QNR0_9BACI|nr:MULTISPECIES: glutathione peroxidase [Bacillaceae]KRF51491.1 glutathione peroxidase [Bacillus sp. Soil745]MBD8137702.1 glutathione peroxidase [Bacillus sp. CFBP 13597]MCD1160146.1 glutathione peroxidase [Peribacillus castrilensis]MDP9740539.1 glutathione peroxidase [Bacillus sp. B2I3]PEF36767.1 glutathione peroxidase [Bacillus sp. AFS094228]PEO47355.1 glutathione peroxidase [Bacillus sp. AFS026049]QNK47679.1 glutathione peroxidase [Brevibacterium sp. PAMC23299]QYF80221.1 glutathione pero